MSKQGIDQEEKRLNLEGSPCIMKLEKIVKSINSSETGLWLN